MTSNTTRPPRAALFFNPHVAALPPYNAGVNVAIARSVSGQDEIARLGSNENPDGCSPAVMTALASSRFEPWRYADPACRELRAAISKQVDVPSDELVVGNGSEEMIAAISRAFLTPGATVVTVIPSFGLHEVEPLAAGATVTKIAMTSDFGFDVDALEQALAKQPEVFFLPTPWNPVGPALDRASLTRLIHASSPSTLFVLDEAYCEFSDPDTPDGIELLRSFDVPHVVLRTFSKAYGLAGLRVGYAACSNPEIARVIAAAKTPFNVNAAGQLAAIAAIEDEAWMRESVARICVERERVRAALEGLGLQVAPSETNFLFFNCGTNAYQLATELLSEGIIVKGWMETGYLDFMRTTIGRADENDRLIASLTRHLGG